MIQNGTTAVSAFLGTFYDTMALVAALLITVAVLTTFLDGDSQEQCGNEDTFLIPLCNTQVLAGVTACVCCILELFWCILLKLILNVWPQDAFASFIIRYWFLGFYVTVGLMTALGISFATSFNHRMALQTFAYDKEWEW